MAEAKCPECGKMGHCYYLGDNSITHNILDDYRFLCPYCGADKRETMDGGEVGHEERLTNCPFCGNNNLHHPESGVTMERAEAMAAIAKQYLPKICPTCGQPLPAKEALALLEGTKPKPAKKKDGELCPKCGEHMLSCEYLGERGKAETLCHVWDHNCQCGFHDQLTRQVKPGAECGGGKEGGCPGHCD